MSTVLYCIPIACLPAQTRCLARKHTPCVTVNMQMDAVQEELTRLRAFNKYEEIERVQRIAADETDTVRSQLTAEAEAVRSQAAADVEAARGAAKADAEGVREAAKADVAAAREAAKADVEAVRCHFADRPSAHMLHAIKP